MIGLSNYREELSEELDLRFLFCPRIGDLKGEENSILLGILCYST
jgi:hypothetical protein